MFYQKPCLPELPIDLRSIAIDIAKSGINGSSWRQASRPGIDSATYDRFSTTSEIVEWCSKNIYTGIVDNFKIGIQIFHNGLTYSPHVDGPRGTKILNYLLDAGGTEVDTVWYQEKDQPLYRSQGMNFNSAENLNEVYRTRFEENDWFIIQGNIIHSVVNLSSDRISLSIGFSEDEYQRASVNWYPKSDSN